MKNVSSTTRSPLRIGLLIDSFVQRQWIYKVIEEIQSSGFAQVAVVIKNEASSTSKQRPVEELLAKPKLPALCAL